MSDGAHRTDAEPWFRDRFVRRAILVAVMAIAVTVVANALGGRDAGGSAADQHGVTSVALPTPVVSGNCPDARQTAAQLAGLVTLVGPGGTALDLAPAAGCSGSGAALRAYRGRVLSANLVVSYQPGAWSAASAQLRGQMPSALAHSLRHLYPAARVSVIVQAGGTEVAHSKLVPRTGVGR